MVALAIIVLVLVIGVPAAQAIWDEIQNEGQNGRHWSDPKWPWEK